MMVVHKASTISGSLQRVMVMDFYGSAAVAKQGYLILERKPGAGQVINHLRYQQIRFFEMHKYDFL